MQEIEWSFFREILNCIAKPNKSSLINIQNKLIRYSKNAAMPENKIMASLIPAMRMMIRGRVKVSPENIIKIAQEYEQIDRRKALVVLAIYHHLSWLFLMTSHTKLKSDEKIVSLKKSIQHLNEELKIAEELNHKQLQNSIKRRLGKIYRSLGIILRKENRLTEALEALEKSLTIHKCTHDVLGIARDYAIMGVILKNMGRLDEALESCRKALEYHEKLKDRLGIAKDYANMGIIYRHKGDFNKAFQSHMKAIKIREELGDKLGMARDYASISMVLARMGKLNEALDKSYEAIKIREELGDKLGMARDYETLGIILRNMGRLGEALESYEKAFKIYEEHEDGSGIARSYAGIGVLLKNMGKLDKALESHMKALKLHRELGDKLGMARDYASIGIVYRHKGDFNKALESHMKALKLHRELGDKLGMARDYASIGIVYSQKCEWELALKNLRGSLKIRKYLDDKVGIIRTYASIGIVLAQMDKLEEAEEEVQKGLKISESINLPYFTTEALRALRLIHFKKGEKEGFKYQDFCKASHRFKSSWESGQKIFKITGKEDNFNLLILVTWRMFDLLCKVKEGEVPDFQVFKQELHRIVNLIFPSKVEEIALYIQELIYILRLERESGFLQSEYLLKKIDLILEKLGLKTIMRREEAAIMEEEATALIFTMTT